MELAQVVMICTVTAFAFTYVYDWVEFPRGLAARVLSLIMKAEIPPTMVKLPKLLECSLCATTWATLVVLICTTPWYWWWLCLPFGWSTKYMLMLINLTDQLISLAFILIERLIHKLK